MKVQLHSSSAPPSSSSSAASLTSAPYFFRHAAAPACALPYLAWPAVLAACAAQSLFALKAARPAVEPHPREKVLAFAGATCALNAGLALLLKVYLY